MNESKCKTRYIEFKKVHNRPQNKVYDKEMMRIYDSGGYQMSVERFPNLYTKSDYRITGTSTCCSYAYG